MFCESFIQLSLIGVTNGCDFCILQESIGTKVFTALVAKAYNA